MPIYINKQQQLQTEVFSTLAASQGGHHEDKESQLSQGCGDGQA